MGRRRYFEPTAPIPIPTSAVGARRTFRLFYFTGKPCKHGHVANRYAAGGACVECSRLSPAELFAREVEREHKRLAR